MKKKPSDRSSIGKGSIRIRETGLNPASAKSIAEQYFDLQRLRRRVRLAEMAGAYARHRIANDASPLIKDYLEN
jgi:hypothetical protein